MSPSDMCFNNTAEKSFGDAKSRLCNTMVHNPIYEGEGPVYESVQPQSKTSTAAAVTLLATVTVDTFADQHYDSLHNPDAPSPLDESTLKMVCRSDHSTLSSQPQNKSTISSNAYTQLTVPDSGTASTPSPPAGTVMMALKKNGQERNKLHLTLSLRGNDSGQNTCDAWEADSPRTCSTAMSDMDENAFGSLSHSLKVGCSKATSDDTVQQ